MTSAMKESFGQRIRDLRTKAGLSQREIADMVGFSFTYLSKIENDAVPPPSEETIKGIAKALGEPSDELVLLAKKIPSDLYPIIQESSKVPAFLRSATKRGLKDADWGKLIQYVEEETAKGEVRYIDELRQGEVAQKLAERISELRSRDRKLVVVEVCGSHTPALSKAGIKEFLKDDVELLSSPGCFNSVTQDYVDMAIAYARRKDVIIVTFGDMLKVPALRSGLEQEKAKGHDIRIVYSPTDAVKIASDNPAFKTILLGAGLDATAPPIAVSILAAERMQIKNYFVFSSLRLATPVIRALVLNDAINVDGFIAPGNVSAIIGMKPYQRICDEYNVPIVIAGFGPLDVLQAIFMLSRQTAEGIAHVQNQYEQAVKEKGNPKALTLIKEIFEEVDCEWRGLGFIPDSGLRIRESYRRFDAQAELEP